MSLHMLPHMACLERCALTLVALLTSIWLGWASNLLPYRVEAPPPLDRTHIWYYWLVNKAEMSTAHWAGTISGKLSFCSIVCLISTPARQDGLDRGETTIDWENWDKLITPPELWVCSQTLKGPSHHPTIGDILLPIFLKIFLNWKCLVAILCVENAFAQCFNFLARLQQCRPALCSSRKSIASSRDGIEMERHRFSVDLCRRISLLWSLTFILLKLKYMKVKTSEWSGKVNMERVFRNSLASFLGCCGLGWEPFQGDLVLPPFRGVLCTMNHGSISVESKGGHHLREP